MDIGVQKKNHSQSYDNHFNDLRSGKRLIQLMALSIFTFSKHQGRIWKLIGIPSNISPFFFSDEGMSQWTQEYKISFH